MKRKRTTQPVRRSLGEGGSAPAHRSRLLRRAYSAEAAAKAGSGCEGWIGEGGFMNRRVLLGMLVFSGALLLALFSIARPQPLSSERTRNLDPQASRPLHLPITPSGGVQEAWVTRYNGPHNGGDSVQAIAIDSSGNVYVAGGSAVSDIVPDYATIKYDSAGQQQWVAYYNGPDNNADFAEAIAVDASGNVYVTGESYGSGSIPDYATIKYNSSGQQQWVALYNGPAHDDERASAIVVDASGNVYVTGWSRGTDSGHDYATIKYDSSGQEQWVARYNGPGNDEDYARGIAVDASGNIYVTGESFGSGTERDYATVKYNPAGQQQWVARYNGPGNGTDAAYAMAGDSSGNVYVTGASLGTTFPDFDYATIMYNSAGEQQWVARYNSPGNGDDGATAITIDGSGNVYVTGQSGHNDYLTVKYDPAGQERWVASYSGPYNGAQLGLRIAVDGSGNVYVTGQSAGPAFADDYATVKYDESGQQQWAARYNGPGNSGDSPSGLVVDASGNVYVTGTSVGLGTNTDYATIKYVQGPPPTPSPSPTASPTPTPTPSATASPTPTPTPPSSPTPTGTPSSSPSSTPMDTPTPTPTASPNPTATAAASPSPTPTPTATPSATPTVSATVRPKPIARPRPSPSPRP